MVLSTHPNFIFYKNINFNNFIIFWKGIINIFSDNDWTDTRPQPNRGAWRDAWRGRHVTRDVTRDDSSHLLPRKTKMYMSAKIQLYDIIVIWAWS